MTDQTKQAPAPAVHENSNGKNAKRNEPGLAELVSDLLAAGVNSEQLLIVIQFFETSRANRRERNKRRGRRGRRCCRKG